MPNFSSDFSLLGFMNEIFVLEGMSFGIGPSGVMDEFILGTMLLLWS
jgi:hypothetical protein